MSTTIASSRTAPVTMYRVAVSRLSSVSPFAMDWSTSTPSSADHALPRPPNRLVPPMTAAAIAVR